MPFARNPHHRSVDWLARCAVPILAAIILAFSAAVGDAAAATDVFLVRGISVDETADTAAAARAAAFRRGQREALNILLRRLTQRADHGRLPAVDAERLEFMVRALQVADEKTSAVRYLAKMTVAFKPLEVRRLLREAGIPFAESVSKPVLVMPVMQRDGALILWDEPNEWRAAWSQLPASDGLVPLIAPVGDLSDISDVDAAQAADGDPLRLSAIASRYGAGDVLVAIATLSPTAAGTQVDITARRIGAPSQRALQSAVEIADPAVLPATLLAAAQGIAEAVQDTWKSANLLSFDRPGQLVVAVPLASLEQLVSVERRLTGIAAISNVALISLTRDAAAFEITHFGDEAQLTVALAQQDLALEQPAVRAGTPDPFGAVQTGTASTLRVLRPIEP